MHELGSYKSRTGSVVHSLGLEGTPLYGDAFGLFDFFSTPVVEGDMDWGEEIATCGNIRIRHLACFVYLRVWECERVLGDDWTTRYFAGGCIFMSSGV